jgi:hypothetical protein
MKHIEELLPDLNIENTEMQCTMDESGCCIVASNDTERAFWDDKWAAGATGWDLSGTISEEFLNYFNSITNKSASILIPGCGNAYEAEYLLNQGFKNITLIDISPTLTRALCEKFGNNPNVRVVEGDFFEFKGQFDYIIEQTFFCAIPPAMRNKYVQKMRDLLGENSELAGLLFNRDFEGGPPFSGSVDEYKKVFPENGLEFIELRHADKSISARKGTEVFFRARVSRK